MNIKIIYEDSDLLVIDKPSGITVNRSDTTREEETVQDFAEKYLKITKGAEVAHKNFLVRNARQKLSQDSLRESASTTNENFESSPRPPTSDNDFFKRGGIVHRIDKETSGILLIAKNPAAFLNLQKQFKERKVEKTYVALVHEEVKPEIGEINVPVGRLSFNRRRFGIVAGGREAVTKYKALKYLEVQNGKWDTESLISRNRNIKKSSSKTSHFTLLELYPKTGRTHQIRVHLKYFGHPVFSDPLYAGRKVSRTDRKLLPRLFLHAANISFLHPKTGKQVSFKSDLPKDLENFLSNLNE